MLHLISRALSQLIQLSFSKSAQTFKPESSITWSLCISLKLHRLVNTPGIIIFITLACFLNDVINVLPSHSLITLQSKLQQVLIFALLLWVNKFITSDNNKNVLTRMTKMLHNLLVRFWKTKPMVVKLLCFFFYCIIILKIEKVRVLYRIIKAVNSVCAARISTGTHF